MDLLKITMHIFRLNYTDSVMHLLTASTERNCYLPAVNKTSWCQRSQSLRHRKIGQVVGSRMLTVSLYQNAITSYDDFDENKIVRDFVSATSNGVLWKESVVEELVHKGYEIRVCSICEILGGFGYFASTTPSNYQSWGSL